MGSGSSRGAGASSEYPAQPYGPGPLSWDPTLGGDLLPGGPGPEGVPGRPAEENPMPSTTSQVSLRPSFQPYFRQSNPKSGLSEP